MHERSSRVGQELDFPLRHVADNFEGKGVKKKGRRKGALGGGEVHTVRVGW